MTRALFALLAVAGMAGLTGCAHTQKSCGSLGQGADCASSDCATTTSTCGGGCSGGCGSCGYDPCNIFSSGCGMQCGCGTQCGGACGQAGRGMGGGALGLGMAGGFGMGGRTPRGWDSQQPLVSGPATGAMTYPYYTVRGPRDFLASDPRPIGP